MATLLRRLLLPLVLLACLLHARPLVGWTWEFDVHYTINYEHAGTGDNIPLKDVMVEVWEDDIFDSHLVDAYTNGSGQFDVHVQSNEGNGPDLFVKIHLDDKEHEVVKVVEGAGNEDVILTSPTRENVTTESWFTHTATVSLGYADECNLYQVVYNIIEDTDFGTKTMRRIRGKRVASGNAFTSDDLVTIADNDVWYAYGNPNYGDFLIAHEVGHAVMWKMYDDEFPNPMGYSPDNHTMYTEAGRGFALAEGWADLYGAMHDGVVDSSSNWNFSDPEAQHYWAGADDDGTDYAGLTIEGAIASAGYLIGYNDVWTIIRDQGNAIDSFEDLWDYLDKTQAQRDIVERNNMIFSRGKFTHIKEDSGAWQVFSDGYEVAPDTSTLSFRVQPNDYTDLRLVNGEQESPTDAYLSYRSVGSLANNTTWYPYSTGWTNIGTATTNGSYWELDSWTKPAPGDYWIRAQTMCTGNTKDSVMPGYPYGYSDVAPFPGMRAWNRGTLKAILHLRIKDPAAGDPSFLQADRRNAPAVELAQAQLAGEHACREAEAQRKRALKRMLQDLENRLRR